MPGRRWMRANAAERMDALDRSGVFDRARQRLHEERYRFAGPLAAGLRVADIACGTGYGSRILAEAGAREVLGLDLDAEAVRYARRRHGRSGVRFEVASATRTPLAAGSVDLIVSLETIEHVAETDALLDEFRRILAPGGRLLVSAPNDTGLTPYHVHTWTPFEFERVVAPHLSVAARWEVHLRDGRGESAGVEIVEPGRLPQRDAESVLLLAAKEGA